VGISHDKLHVTTAEIPENYFPWMNDEIIPAGECLVLRRSNIFDLSQPVSRKEACRMVLGVMKRISAIA
jgi:hypothetical protein